MRVIHHLLFACLALTTHGVTGHAAEYQLLENISYRPSQGDPYEDDQCRLDLYVPTGQTNFATVVWFHGGGLSSGHRSIPEALKEQGIAVVGAGYRLYPKVKAPAYLEDAASAVAWTVRNIARHGGDPTKVFVSGHSAGGYLTSMIGLDRRWLQPHGLNPDDLAGLIPFSGHAITHFTVRQERGIPKDQPIIDDLAPLYHVRSNAPPLLLITGDRELEMLGRYEENAYLWRMMKGAGHTRTVLLELDGYHHGNMPQGAFPLLLNHVRQSLQAGQTHAAAP